MIGQSSKFLHIPVLVLGLMLFTHCQHQSCIRQHDLTNFSNHWFFRKAQKLAGDTTALVDFVLSNLSKMDRQDVRSDGILVKVADLLDSKNIAASKANLLRHEVVSSRRAVKLLMKNEDTPETATFRLIQAHAAYRWASSLWQEGKIGLAGYWFRVAYWLSPERMKHAPCQSVAAFINSRKEYSTPFADFLHAIGEDSIAYQVCWLLANRDAAYLPRLKALHQKLFPDDNFEMLWQTNRFARLPRIHSFRFVTIQGDTSSLSQLSGKWVFIDFWSRGCIGCLKEFPNIEKMFARYHATNPPGKEFLTIAVETNRSKVIDALRKSDGSVYSFPVAMPDFSDSLNVSRFFSETVRLYPTKMILTPDRHYFYIPIYDWQNYVRKYLIRKT